MQLSEVGKNVEQKILEMSKHYEVKIDCFCIMPNHIHVVMVISPGKARGPAPTLGEYVKRLKTITAKKQKIWQRNYYEHIVRDEDDLYRIRKYIDSNVNNWIIDKLNNS
jgi:REP element-mobilizing transposase RayT